MYLGGSIDVNGWVSQQLTDNGGMTMGSGHVQGPPSSLRSNQPAMA
jgi:hypothetical protein